MSGEFENLYQSVLEPLRGKTEEERKQKFRVLRKEVFKSFVLLLSIIGVFCLIPVIAFRLYDLVETSALARFVVGITKGSPLLLLAFVIFEVVLVFWYIRRLERVGETLVDFNHHLKRVFIPPLLSHFGDGWKYLPRGGIAKFEMEGILGEVPDQVYYLCEDYIHGEHQGHCVEFHEVRMAYGMSRRMDFVINILVHEIGPLRFLVFFFALLFAPFHYLKNKQLTLTRSRLQVIKVELQGPSLKDTSLDYDAVCSELGERTNSSVEMVIHNGALYLIMRSGNDYFEFGGVSRPVTREKIEKVYEEVQAVFQAIDSILGKLSARTSA